MNRPTSIARRLLVAQVLVIVAMAATVAAVATVVGPSSFVAHMRLAGAADPDVLMHGEEAFESAGLSAMVAGLTIAGLGAILASVLLTRRLRASLGALAAGAERVASGDYSTPVELTSADRELATVARSFNDMTARVADTEATRRRLLTDLSHEIRTPLAAIDLLVEGIGDGVVVPDAATAATLRAQTARLARLASDLRDVSAAEEGRLGLRLERLPVARVVEGSAAAARPGYAAAGVTLEVAGGPDAAIEADPARLGQVLDNLLRNALQHSAPGQRVTVSWDADGAVARVFVRDQGEGISAADLPHVFERFFRGAGRRRDEGSGTGVGLAIARAITHAHGGSLTAASDGPGRGAEFVLTLPAA